MHPETEEKCQELLEDPILQTPPLEPEPPKPPRIRKPRVFKVAKRFPLLDKEFYAIWVSHQKELQMATHKVDDHPPQLYPELYLKPRRLNLYARQLEENMKVNKELLKRINVIQRNGGYVDCWRDEPTGCNFKKLICKRRQLMLDEIQHKNLHIYSRLLVAKSEQPDVKELNEFWKYIKHKLILSAALPFILFKTGSLDQGIKDPAMDKPSHIYRPRVSIEVWVHGGSKIGLATIELFTDICPLTCRLFLSLIKGEPKGYAYTGTRIFRIVPELYCCCGDVTKDNGFGCYIPQKEGQPLNAENFTLNHTIPGVVSMVINKDNEVCGQFNIIFKPLPQFNGKHVVFGRIVAGPAQFLERISAIGLPLGTPYNDVIIRTCGWFSRSGIYHEGQPNTIRFPNRRKN